MINIALSRIPHDSCNTPHWLSFLFNSWIHYLCLKLVQYSKISRTDGTPEALVAGMKNVIMILFFFTLSLKILNLYPILGFCRSPKPFSVQALWLMRISECVHSTARSSASHRHRKRRGQAGKQVLAAPSWTSPHTVKWWILLRILLRCPSPPGLQPT